MDAPHLRNFMPRISRLKKYDGSTRRNKKSVTMNCYSSSAYRRKKRFDVFPSSFLRFSVVLFFLFRRFLHLSSCIRQSVESVTDGVLTSSEGQQPCIAMTFTILCVCRQFPPVRNKKTRRRLFGDFLGPAFPAGRTQHVSDLHFKFAPWSHHVSKYGRHPICDG